MTKIETQNLNVEVTVKNSVLLANFQGNLDVFSLQKVKPELEKYTDLHQKMIFNLAKLDYLDSAGIGFIVGTLKKIRAKDKNARLVICSLNDYLTGIFNLINFSRIVPVAADLDRAWKELDEE